MSGSRASEPRCAVAPVYGRHGILLRFMMLCVASIYWLGTLGGILTATRCITLCYHGVTGRQHAAFVRQMKLIARHTIDVRMSDGRRPWLGRPRVCVTFDDAFANLRTNALPAVRCFGIPVVIFAVSENLGCQPRWKFANNHPDGNELTMTPKQLRAAVRWPGCTIGSHSATHTPMTELAARAYKDEMARSKQSLEQILGAEIADFAFPYGACTADLVHAAHDAGYRRVHTLHSIRSRRGRVISRMKACPDMWWIEFALTVAGAYEWVSVARMLRHLSRPSMARRSGSSLQVLHSPTPSVPTHR